MQVDAGVVIQLFDGGSGPLDLWSWGDAMRPEASTKS